MKKLIVIFMVLLSFMLLSSFGWGYNSSQNRIQDDYSDCNFTSYHNGYHDTVLSSGWQIKYLVNTDSTDRNLYIEWTKNGLSGFWLGEDILEAAEIFVPKYVDENPNYIFMEHACGSTGCKALLLLFKDRSNLKYRRFMEVVDYSVRLEQILYLTDKNYKQDSILEVSLVDLKTGTERFVAFDHKCTCVFKSSYIHAVVFGTSKSVIRAKFDDIVEEKIISLK